MNLKFYATTIFYFFLGNLFAQPIISNFSPSSGVAGSSVVINGSNFSSTVLNNTVYFGAAKATVISSSNNSLNVTVPSGCTYESITITVNGLTAYSAKPFILTYPGGGNINNSSFLPKVNFETDLHPNCNAMVDLDNDGKLDVATANNYSTTGVPASISILRNISTIGNINFAPKQDFNNGVLTYGITYGDIDGDGKQDIITTSIVDQNISVFRNTSTTGNISFANKIDFASENSPYNIAIKDLDGNGKPDIVVVNATSGIVSIYRNLSTIGSVSFAPKQDLATQINPQDLTLGDFDGDNKYDIAVTNKLSNSFSIFRNISISGNIAFAARFDISCGAGNQPVGIIDGDFDGDNKNDIAIVISQSNANGSFAQIFKNNSSPGILNFNWDITLIGDPNNNAYHITAGDLNGDGKIDLAFAVTGADYSKVFENYSVLGSIIFLEKTQLQSFNPYPISIGDLNGDGRADVVASNFTSTNISVFKNNCGTPEITSFSPAIGSSGLPITITGNNFNNVTSVTMGGVNASSFVVVNSTTITAILGNGASGNIVVTNSIGSATIAGFIFSNVPLITSFYPTVGGNGTLVTINGANLLAATSVSFGGTPASSFNIISATEITAVVSFGASGNVKIKFGTDSVSVPNFVHIGNIPIVNTVSPTSGLIGSTVTIIGINFSSTALNNLVYFGDVKATVISATNNILNVAVPAGANYKNISVTVNGKTAFSKIPFIITQLNPANITTSSFAPKTDLALGSVSTYGVETGDIDNDGKSDLVATKFNDIKVSIFKNISTLNSISFAPKIDSATGSYPTAVGLTDLDGDGRKDLMTTGVQNVSVFRNLSTSGNIVFGEKQFFSAFGFNKIISIGDITPDGKPDVALATSASNKLLLLKNSSSTSINLEAPFEILLNNEVNSTCIGDFNNDGLIDVAAILTVGTTSNGILSVHKNLSSVNNILLDNAVEFATGFRPFGVTTGDFNADGKLDIAVVNYEGNSVSVYKNTSTNGNISFANKIDYATGFQPRSVTLGDLNGDGKIDMVVVNASLGTLSLFQNNSSAGSISFLPKIDIATGQFPQYAAIADFDGNGKPDIAVACYGTGVISIHRNVINEMSLTSFTPMNGFATTSVTISGNNFLGVTAVSFGGVNASSFTIVNSTTITAIVGSGASGNVTVTSPNGSVSLAGFVFINPPTIVSFSPLSATTNSTVTIIGTNLQNINVVSFGGVPALSFNIVNSNTITAIVGTGASGNVFLSSLAGNVTMGGFTYIPTSFISSFVPVVGSSGQTITITGNNFIGITGVSFGGTAAASFIIVNQNTITAIVGNGSSGAVSIASPNGNISLAGFNFLSPPIINSFSPNIASSGTSVSIVGNHFAGTTSVKFGGVNASLFSIVNDNTINAIVGQGSSGNVTVSTNAGTNSKLGFTYIPPPQINSIFPLNATSGTSITITGINFLNVTSITFGGVPVSSYTTVNANTIIVLIGNVSSGNVVITTAGGVSTFAGFTFGRNAVPINPNELYISPNPANAMMVANHPTSLVGSIEIINAEGKIIRYIKVNGNATQTTINLHSIPSGLYRLRWTDHLKILQKTIIVIH